MDLFKKEKRNIVAVTLQLLDKLKVKVNKSTIATCLETHPEYPSLLSVSDCLTELNIDTEAYRLDPAMDNLSDLSFPLITHVAKDGGNFVLLNGLPTPDFLKDWTGLVLTARRNKKSGEKDYFQNRLKGILEQLRLPFFLVAVFLGCILLFNLHAFQWQILGIGLLKLAGLSLSILLLMNTLNYNLAFIQNFCAKVGNNDCNNLLRSKAAQLTSWLSWSEIGFFYFAGSFLTLLVLPSVASLMAGLNLLALPFTVYSFVYQYRAKNWCLLCCLVQLVLLLECLVFAIARVFLSSGPIWHNHFLLPVFLLFLLPVLTWALLKPVLRKASLLNPLQYQLKRFKNDSALFKWVLRNQEYYIINEELMPVSLGHPKAKTVITIVSNPFCGPCGQVHLLLEEWLQQRDDLQMKIIFVNENKDDDLNTQVAQHMMALNLLEDTALVIQALQDWYRSETKDYDSWAKKYPVIITNAIKTAGKKQKSWCKQAEIAFTPTILINGYKLPELYQLEDIKYLLYE